MTDQTQTTNPFILAVEQAKAAVLTATSPEQYREAQRALIAAGVALRDRVWDRHQWLIRNWERLDEYELTLPPAEFEAKEAIYLAKLEEYEAWFRVLAHALTVVALPGPEGAEDAVKAKEPVMMQGGLL